MDSSFKTSPLAAFTKVERSEKYAAVSTPNTNAPCYSNAVNATVNGDYLNVATKQATRVNMHLSAEEYCAAPSVTLSTYQEMMEKVNSASPALSSHQIQPTTTVTTKTVVTETSETAEVTVQAPEKQEKGVTKVASAIRSFFEKGSATKHQVQPIEAEVIVPEVAKVTTHTEVKNVLRPAKSVVIADIPLTNRAADFDEKPSAKVGDRVKNWNKRMMGLCCSEKIVGDDSSMPDDVVYSPYVTIAALPPPRLENFPLSSRTATAAEANFQFRSHATTTALNAQAVQNSPAQNVTSEVMTPINHSHQVIKQTYYTDANSVEMNVASLAAETPRGALDINYVPNYNIPTTVHYSGYNNITNAHVQNVTYHDTTGHSFSYNEPVIQQSNVIRSAVPQHQNVSYTHSDAYNSAVQQTVSASDVTYYNNVPTSVMEPTTFYNPSNVVVTRAADGSYYRTGTFDYNISGVTPAATSVERMVHVNETDGGVVAEQTVAEEDYTEEVIPETQELVQSADSYEVPVTVGVAATQDLVDESIVDDLATQEVVHEDDLETNTPEGSVPFDEHSDITSQETPCDDIAEEVDEFMVIEETCDEEKIELDVSELVEDGALNVTENMENLVEVYEDEEYATSEDDGELQSDN